MSEKQRESLYFSGIYLQVYNTIVRPRQIFPISYYSLRRWTPHLGATGFWLLVTLQQECYKNNSNWCVVDRTRLATAASLSPATVHRYLHGQGYLDSGLCHWVSLQNRRGERQWSNRAGRMVQATNRYTIVLDAPLAPVDQRGLAQYLLDKHASKDSLPAIFQTLAQYNLKELLDQFDECACRFVPPAGWDQFYPTVADVASAILNLDPDWTRSLEACVQLHNAITGPLWLCTQYFRQKWLPKLGSTLALVVVQLRSRCFWTDRHKQDTVSIGTKALAHQCGCEEGWLRMISSSPDRKTLPQNVRTVEQIEFAKLFFHRLKSGSGRQPIFQVNLCEPMAPEDRDEYDRQLAAYGKQLSLSEPYIVKGSDEHPPSPEPHVVNSSKEHPPAQPHVMNSSENPGDHQPHAVNSSEVGLPSQPSFAAILDGHHSSQPHVVNGQPHVVNGSTDQPPSQPHVVNGQPHVVNGQPHVVNGSEGLTACGEQVTACGEHHVKHVKQLNTETFNKQQQQHIVTASWPLGLLRERIVDPAAAAATILFDFGIRSSVNQDLAQANPVHILAWCLYAALDSGLNRPQGYVITRLRAGDEPNERFLHWASLSPEQWRQLWQATEDGSWKQLDPELQPDLPLWRADFDGLWSTGPFGDQQASLPAWPILPSKEPITSFDQDLTSAPASSPAPVFELPGCALTNIQVWALVLEQLGPQLTPAAIETWLRPAALVAGEGDVITIRAHNAYASDWLAHRARELIEEALATVLERPVQVQFVTAG